ncbi:MAG: hypothetical protein ACRCSN_03545 [Dermatophilaceae bacterium]
MTRFSWAAWGLLVVVLDLPFGRWDVLPDLVGYVWLILGLAGGADVAFAFVRARAAAAAGIPVWVATGTPLVANTSRGTVLDVTVVVLLTAILLDIVVLAAICHQLAAGVERALGDDDPGLAGSTRRLRIGAIAAGVAGAVGIGVYTSAPPLFALGQLALVVLGVLTTVLVYRVARSGRLEPAEPQRA